MNIFIKINGFHEAPPFLPNAKGFIRMNIATSKANVLKGLKIFRKGIKHFKNNLK